MKVLNAGFLDVIRVHGDESTIAEVARMSYGKTETPDAKTSARLCRDLVTKGHLSPLAQASIQFHVKAPLFVARQWVRHVSHAARWNEKSLRYTKSTELNFYVPPLFRADPMVRGAIANANTRAMGAYAMLLNEGVKPELARVVLPASVYVEWKLTVSVKDIMYGFLVQRLDKHAQWEIRQYAEAMLKHLHENFPNVAEAFENKHFGADKE